MKESIKIVIIFVVIGGLLLGVWLSLDSYTKCKLIYEKDICNFYEMMGTVDTNPENSDFEKAMQLCQDMEDVSKKDSCFKYVAQVVSFYDMEKAREACSEIEQSNAEDCYSMIGSSIEERLAESAIASFMEARLQRDEELASSWLTDNAKGKYVSLSGLSLVGLSNPHFADYEILEQEKLNDTQFIFKVRIYEEYTGQGKVGFFDETLTVIKNEDKYLIDSAERSQYTDL